MAARKKRTQTTKKATKRKAPVRKASTKAKSRKSTKTTESVASMDSASSSNSNKLYWVIGVVAVLLVLYLLRGLLLVSTVDGKPVYRLSVIKRLEQLGGTRVVEEITRRYLVEDKLAELGITISDEEIEAEIDEARQLFEAQGVSFEEALEQDNLTLDDVREISRYQRGLRLLAEQELTEITDEDVAAYYEANSDFYEDQPLEDVRESIKSAMQEQSLQQKEQEVITTLLAEANIVTFKEY